MTLHNSDIMNIPYRELGDYQDVDISLLRPKKSYDKLISERNHSINKLIDEYGSIPSDLLVKRPCPCCGSNEYSLSFQKDHFDIVKCNNCDVLFVNPVFDESHYLETYRSETYQKIVQDLGEESHQYRVNRFGKERVEIMSKYLIHPFDEKISYLDVGCSTGFVVEAANNFGWNAEGIDLNPSAINFGQKRGLNLDNISFFDDKLSTKSFDVISMFDVLEHVINPLNYLSRAYELLSEGGLLFLYVPNYDCASRLLMGFDAHFIWPTHHLTYFTPVTLKTFCESQSFKTLLLNTEGLDIADYIWYLNSNDQDTSLIENISGSLQFMINAGCYGKNLRLLVQKN